MASCNQHLMPLIRGRFVPEVEGSGRAKQYLDVVLWCETLQPDHLSALDQLEQLRTYLGFLDPPVCSIRLWVPERHDQTSGQLSKFDIEHQLVAEQVPPIDVKNRLDDADPELLTAVGTSFSIGAGCLVVGNPEWLPFAQE